MLIEKIEAWYERIGRKLGYFLLAILVLFFFFKYILRLILPFAIAWGLAMLLNPVVTWLQRHGRLPRGLGTLLSMLTVLSAFIGIVTLVVQQIWTQAKALAESFDLYIVDVNNMLSSLEAQLQSWGDTLPIPLTFSSLDAMVTEVMTFVSSFLDEIIKVAYAMVASVPNGIFILIVILIAVFFMTKDYYYIKAFLRAQIPERTMMKLSLIQKGLINALGGYVKTQLILMLFTFTICLIGLFLLGRQYTLLIALGIAMLDALPVFGSGAILIPWGVYHIITGNYLVGIGLLTIYITIVVMRQIMEPKVLSTQIGVYALVTLMAMYIGAQLIGVFGMILGPITVVIIRTCQTIGVIPDFKPIKK